MLSAKRTRRLVTLVRLAAGPLFLKHHRLVWSPWNDVWKMAQPLPLLGSKRFFVSSSALCQCFFCFVGCVTNVDQETCIVFGRILTNFKTLKNGLRVAPFAKANGMKRKRAGLADDGSGNPKKQLKGGDLPPESSTPGSNKNQFKGYDLLQVPKEAWPQQKENKGKHGYTLTAANGAVTCSHEVNMHAIYWSEPPQYSLWVCITIHGVKHSKYSLSAYIEKSPTVHSAAPFSAVLQRHLRRSNASSRARHYDF